MAKKVRIGDKLVEKGYITEEQLKWALSEQKNSGKRLGEFLVQEGLIDSNLLISVLKELLDIESIFLVRDRNRHFSYKNGSRKYMQKIYCISI